MDYMAQPVWWKPSDSMEGFDSPRPDLLTTKKGQMTNNQSFTNQVKRKIIRVNNFPFSTPLYKINGRYARGNMIAIGRLFVYNFETFDSWCQHESRIQTHRYQRLSSDAAAMAFA